MNISFDLDKINKTCNIHWHVPGLIVNSNLPFADCDTRNCSESSVSLERISTIIENRES